MPDVSLVMVKIADLAVLLGVENIKDLPGCWEHQLSEDWWFALNGHNEPTKTSRDQELRPYNCLIEFMGLPVGYISPFEGVFANGKEDDFIKEVDLRIQQEAKDGKEIFPNIR